ncbi:MAG: hypothetical protein GF418_00940 [Chitinivibrionales bacterium]|nr:hypothetical protein [Chitinivibrionales bacterium]MBD3394167.1 hypothetical protein [Chitinivibrionales bacterium]
MFLKKALCTGVALALVLSGCGKKKEQEIETALSEMPELEAAGETKDTGDIFNEFYDEEKTQAEPEEAPPADDFYAGGSYTAEFVPGGRYVVQVSCVASRALADKVAADLEAKGWPAYVAEVENPTPDLIGTYYRIRIGGFSYVTPARQFGENALIPAGYEFWVDNRSNDNVGMGGYGLGQSDVGEYGEYGGTSEPAATASEPVSEWGTSSTTSSEWETSTEPATPPPAEPAPMQGEPATTSEPAATPAAAEPAPAEPAATAPAPEAAAPAPAAQEPATASEPAATGTEAAPADDWGSEDDWGSDSDW